MWTRSLRGRSPDEFALRAGDVFNSASRPASARRVAAPDQAARSARARTYRRPFTNSAELASRRRTFDLIDRDGQRVLLVGLREPPGRFKMRARPRRARGLVLLGRRVRRRHSAWALAVFDHQRFNHTFVAGHLSYKIASERAGYALGFERPLFSRTKVYIGAELHDLTATDDQWQLSSVEASLAAVGPRRSFRDYYGRRGVQIDRGRASAPAG